MGLGGLSQPDLIRLLRRARPVTYVNPDGWVERHVNAERARLWDELTEQHSAAAARALYGDRGTGTPLDRPGAAPAAVGLAVEVNDQNLADSCRVPVRTIGTEKPGTEPTRPERSRRLSPAGSGSGLHLIPHGNICQTVADKAVSAAKNLTPGAAKIDAAARWVERGLIAAAGAALTPGESKELRSRAAAIGKCERVWKVAVNLTDPTRSRLVPIRHCRQRLCPRCQAIRGRKWQDRVAPLAAECRAEGYVPKFVTLTQVSREGEPLRETRRRFEKSFRAFYRSKQFRGRSTGWCASREVTWSNGAWHYHVHMIADMTYWNQPDLSAFWQSITGDSFIVDIREACEGDEREILKYATKALTIPRDRLAELVHDLRGARMISTGGTWRGRVTDEMLEPDDNVPDGWKMVGVEELYSHVRAGARWAHVALAAVLDSLPPRGVGWVTRALTAPFDAWREIPPDAGSLDYVTERFLVEQAEAVQA